MNTSALGRTFSSAEEAAGLMGNILESSTECSLIATDMEGVIVLWNEGALRLYGYEPDEIIGKPMSVLHPAEDVEAGLPKTMMEAAFRDGRWAGIVPRVRKDGSAFTARVVMTPRRSVNGTPGGFLLISSDITRETELADRRERADEKFRGALESAPDAMVIVDKDGQIQLVNAETQKLFGYSRDELIGRPVEMLIPERYHTHLPEHRDGFFRQPKARRIGVGLDLWGRRRDNTEFPVEISLSPLPTEEGMLATAAIRDVTARKRSEVELKEANVELEAANMAKDRFLANMSHELRTPLNAILGFTGTMLMKLPGPLNDEQAKQLRTVQANGKHLLSIINDLLDLARIESGKVELNVESVSCAELAEEVVLGLRPLAEQKGIDLMWMAPEDHLDVRSDRRSLTQILINLTNNAIKYTDEGGVRLMLSRQSENGASAIRFSVIDTGRGIDPSDQQKLFAAFEQIHSSSPSDHEGTGLGLYICRRLTELIGGTITFESELGKGSTFALELPW